MIDPTLRALYAAAWVRGLEVKVSQQGDVVVVSARRRTARPTDPDLAPVVPLRPAGGDEHQA